MSISHGVKCLPRLNKENKASISSISFIFHLLNLHLQIKLKYVLRTKAMLLYYPNSEAIAKICEFITTCKAKQTCNIDEAGGQRVVLQKLAILT